MPRSPRGRRTSTAVLAATALLLAAGCGDGGGNGDGGEDGPSPSKPRESASGPAGDADVRALKESQADMALLTEGNLPSGWSQADLDDTTAAGDSPDDLSTRDKDCKKLLDALGGDLDEEEAETDASRSFQKSDEGPYASHKVASYDGAAAKRAFGTFTKMSEACDAFTTHNNEVTVDFTTSGLTVPRTGDESAGVRARGKVKGGPADGRTLTLDLALARVGPSTTGVVTLTVHGGGGGNGNDGGNGGKLAGGLLKTSADRLQQATNGATPTPRAPKA